MIRINDGQIVSLTMSAAQDVTCLPKVSVLMPVYNAAQFVGQAVCSILVQDFDDFELIVINDGSTDESVDILRDHERRDRRLRLIENPNRGLIDTRNQLLREARGEFIAWMDADDVSRADRLALQVSKFEAEPDLVCLGSNVRIIDPDGNFLGIESYYSGDTEIRTEQRKATGFRFASTMQRRSVALATGGFRHPLRIGEDLDFLLRVAEHGSLANIPDTLYKYRQHLLSTCTAMGSYWPEYKTVILELAEERRRGSSDRLQRGEAISLPLPNCVDVEKFIPSVLLDWAQKAHDVGSRRRALGYIWRAMKYSPLRWAPWRALGKTLLS